MRVLDKNEVSEVSGGTLCLVKSLVALKLSLLNSCAPKPAPAPCAPKAPKPRKHC